MDRNHALFMPVATSSVALRKESVDRNRDVVFQGSVFVGSLSARRAWIEIRNSIACRLQNAVALRKESVDRNLKIAKKVLTSM